MEEDFFLNERRIKPSLQLHDVFSKCAGMLTNWEIGTIMFVKLPTIDELTRLVSIVLTVPADAEKPFQVIQQSLWSTPIGSLTLSELEKDVVRDLPQLDKSTFVKQTYHRPILGFDRMWGLVEQVDVPTELDKAAAKIVNDWTKHKQSGTPDLKLK